MGELVRLLCVKLVKAGLLFDGKLSDRFGKRQEFDTKYVSDIESESAGVFAVTRGILSEMGVKDASDMDCKIVRYCCELISRRAAQLVSAALAVLILRIGDPDITIGVDGSVYRFHPKFHDLMTETIKMLVPSNYKFKFVLSDDGSGIGAAIVAAVASKEYLSKF